MSKAVVVPAPLCQAVEAAYSVFAVYSLSDTLAVCRCPVCVDSETEKRLIETPLREIPAALLSEFTHSAHGPGLEREVKHFLPRYFELIARGEAPSSIGFETGLSRLSHWSWLTWSAPETEAVAKLMREVFYASITPGTTLASEATVEEVVLCLARGKADVMPLIREVTVSGSKAHLGTVKK